MQRNLRATALLFGALLLVSTVFLFQNCGQGWSVARDSSLLPFDSANSASFINSWLVNGPYLNDASNFGFERDWLESESVVQPREGAVSGTKPWRYFDDRLFSRNYDDYQDLFSYFLVKRNEPFTVGVVAYAHVYVHSPTDRKDARLWLGADESVKVWLNGLPLAPPAENRHCGFTSAGSSNLHCRDDLMYPITLSAGWNRLLLKVSNKAKGRLGFYARITNAEGVGATELTYSVNGPGAETLTISTQAMSDITDGDALPVAFREWPYVAAKAGENSGIGYSGLTEVEAKSVELAASSFFLQAEGGTPPYRWSLIEGELPNGLSLAASGAITGTVAAGESIATKRFVVRVEDQLGRAVEKALHLAVKERPNKWYEQGRLTALIHAPSHLSEGELPAFAQLMKRQGYRVAMPIAYNNGQGEYYWPSPFSPSAPDTIAKYKAAIENAGLKFGMYLGTFSFNEQRGGYWSGNGGLDAGLLVVEDALRRYHPKAVWFDWVLNDGASVDALFSLIRSYDPETVIIVNGVLSRYNGDWDVIVNEGWCAWEKHHWDLWPFELKWPKKSAMETWRLLPSNPSLANFNAMCPDASTFDPNLPSDHDWKAYLRSLVTLVGEGYIANIDHTPSLNGPIQALGDSQLMLAHMKMADWASPASRPPLYESYTDVDPAPLADETWGYSTINDARTNIFLHMLVNPHFKIGKPSGASFRLDGFRQTVSKVTWMNANVTLPFTQSGDKLVISNFDQVVADEIDTIIKLELAAPYPEVSRGGDAPWPEGNLAYRRPARFLSVAADGSCPSKGCPELSASNTNVASQGNDGRTYTAAQAANVWAYTYEIDLQKVYALQRIAVTFPPVGWATEYKVLLSDDGQHWLERAHLALSGGGREEFSLLPTAARFLRIQALTPSGPGQPGAQMAISEVEAYETASDLLKENFVATPRGNLAFQKPSRFVGSNGVNLPPSVIQYASNGQDGNSSTFALGGNEWAYGYEVDLETVRTVKKVIVRFTPQLWATEYEVRVSSDGAQWSTIAHMSGAAAGVASFELLPTAARFVRVQALKPDGPSQLGTEMGIAELEVYGD